MDCNTFGFMVETYDKQADMIREYALTAFEPLKGPLEVAMYDVKNKRQFLKRMEIANLSLRELHVGSTVSVYGRQLKVTKYNDSRTQQAMEGLHDCVTLAVSIDQLGQVLTLSEQAGLRVAQMRLVQDNGRVVVLQLAGRDAQRSWEEVSGSSARVGPEEANAYFNKARYPTTATYNSCTLCLIRPHILKEGGYGGMISVIQEAGFEISAVEMIHLQRGEALEMFDVYKGVLPYYLTLVDNMIAGPAIALELRAPNGAVLPFRELCGPHDTDIARHLRPDSLRAIFGKDSAQNGVHCTDLEEDGDLECQYVFDSLLKR